jgi:hypothetical protein
VVRVMVRFLSPCWWSVMHRRIVCRALMIGTGSSGSDPGGIVWPAHSAQHSKSVRPGALSTTAPSECSSNAKSLVSSVSSC